MTKICAGICTCDVEATQLATAGGCQSSVLRADISSACEKADNPGLSRSLSTDHVATPQAATPQAAAAGVLRVRVRAIEPHGGRPTRSAQDRCVGLPLCSSAA